MKLNKTLIILPLLSLTLFACNLIKPNPDTSSPTSNQSNDDSFTGNIADLFKQGKDITCTFTHTDDLDNNSSGTVYISGEKMRGDFEMTDAQGQTYQTSVINDTEYNYIWGNQLPQGIKTKHTDFESTPNTNPSDTNSPQEPFDYNQDFDYQCNSWRVDQSQFTPPSNVQFQDFSAQIEQIQQSAQDLNSLQCSTCDQLSGEAKTQCLQALNC